MYTNFYTRVCKYYRSRLIYFYQIINLIKYYFAGTIIFLVSTIAYAHVKELKTHIRRTRRF